MASVSLWFEFGMENRLEILVKSREGGPSDEKIMRFWWFEHGRWVPDPDNPF